MWLLYPIPLQGIRISIHKRFRRYKLDFTSALPLKATKFYRSVIVGGRALTPPTRRSLGEPLPHQLADRT